MVTADGRAAAVARAAAACSRNEAQARFRRSTVGRIASIIRDANRPRGRKSGWLASWRTKPLGDGTAPGSVPRWSAT